MQELYIDGTINCNPADRVKKPIKEVFVGSIYNSEELDQMFRVFRGDPLEQIVIFASYYGMRRSEIIGLKWKNIDFVRKTISVKHVVVESCIDGKLKMIKKDKPKTKSSNRSLPLVLHLIFFGYFANNTAWVAGRQAIRRNISGHNTSCSYDASLPYGNTTTNNHIGCQPAIIFYSDRLRILKSIKAAIFSFPDITLLRQ